MAFNFYRTRKLKSKILKCPTCSRKYVKTPESPDKCLFCKRGWDKDFQYGDRILLLV